MCAVASRSAGHPARRNIVPQRFYRRDALEVARDLLGKHLCHGGVVLRITEVEAYRSEHDTACHARVGRTARNAPMWGPPGRAYVYLCYGLHQMLNLVTDRTGRPAAVLIRACEPVAGLELIRTRRPGLDGPALLDGPGKVARALALDGTFNGHPLYRPGGLLLRDAPPPSGVLAGPRVGVAYAEPRDREAPWRLAVGDSEWVSQRRGLQPLPFQAGPEADLVS
jgi:DNA-3-methyladenine glycosylase